MPTGQQASKHKACWNRAQALEHAPAYQAIRAKGAKVMLYLLTYLHTIWEICQQANKPASIRHVGTARKPWGMLPGCNLGRMTLK